MDTAITCDRDRHLFLPGPKRILALDGGGVRGTITIAFLERIEQVLSDRLGYPVRLGDWFDLVGGTSTGALISGALALGYRTSDIRDFYIHRAQKAFKRPFWRVPIFQAKFETQALRREIEAIVRDLELCSEELVTGLCVVTKRMDTGSPWIVANNPAAPYWESPADAAHIGNKFYKLANLVRASTAAPHFFDPELLPIVEDKSQGPIADVRAAARHNAWIARVLMPLLVHLGVRQEAVFNPRTDGLFVDGGVTPHNNPSLALFHMITLKAYGLCWPMEPSNLSIVSIGTGTHRPRLDFGTLGFGRFPKLALHALLSLMTDTEVMVLKQMQWMGECAAPWKIDSEVGTLCDDAPPGGKMFRFLRYDVKLEQDWLREELELDIPEQDLVRFRCMDDPGTIPDIYRIGQLAAKKQVDETHWLGPMADWCAGPRPSPPPRTPPAEPPSPWARTVGTVRDVAGIVRNLIRSRS
jgi:hypothetical protein